MNVKIRKASLADADAACNVLRRSITESCVEDHRNEPGVLLNWLQNKTPENVARWFANHESFSLVATISGEVTGVGLLTASGEVALCYVLPEARFKGIGKALFDAMELHAMKIQLSEIHLSSTSAAKTFYLSRGFVPSGESEIESGVRAFPMTKRIVAK